MSEGDVCPVCGAERPADAPSGLCPACLLKAGLVPKGAELDDVTILFGPAPSSVLAAFGEEFGTIPPVLLRDADSASEPGPVIRPSSDEIPDPGQRSARLQLFGEIARGGMGAVLKGRDADLGRELAVKILLESHRHKPEMVRRFIEEAQIAGQLQHPGIVPVYELGAFGDRRPYFAMKLVKGHTLAEILANRKTISEGSPRLLSIFESICQTMAYAHARGVIHRDLKPSNVMVGSFGEVQVMDWGLAKVLPRGGTVEDASAGHTKDQATVIATARSGSDSDLSQAGSIMGTPSYMAPEQARGEIDQVDERADVFALGSIFCELLTGQPAFTGRSSGEIQRKAARGELADAVTRLDQNNLGHDPELIALAKSCLASERDDRPRHAGEFAEKMSLYHSRVQDRLRQSEIERAEEKARAEEATKRVAVERQRLRLTVALAASIFGFIVLGGGGWAYVAQQQAARQAATERVVTAALDKATLLRGQAKAAPVGQLSKWSEAQAAANEARSSLEAGEPSAALRSRVVELLAALKKEQTEAAQRAVELDKDRKLFDRLDAINAKSADKVTYLDFGNLDAEYATAFREFGIDVERLEPAEAGRLFKQRANPQDFASRLDDWTFVRRRTLDGDVGPNAPAYCGRLIQTAQAIDEDPWRNSLRSLIPGRNQTAVRRLASDENELSRQPARSLFLLAQALEISRDNYTGYYLAEETEIMKRAWRLSPNDYRISRALASRSVNTRDRVAFSAAAVAAKPDLPDARRRLAEAFLPRKFFHSFYASMGGTAATRSNSDALDTSDWRDPRFLVKCESGDSIRIGPTWPCDPKSILNDDLVEAVAELRSGIRHAPESADLHMTLAMALVLLERYDEAMNERQIVDRIDPKYGQSDRFARILYLKGRGDLAIQVTLQDIAKNPDNKGGYLLIGLSYHEQGKKDLAFSAYRELLNSAHGPPFLATFEGVGLALLKDTGTPEQATAVLHEAIKANPDSIELHDGLASQLKELGKTDESNAELDQAIELLRKRLGSKPEDQLYRRLITMFERQGKTDESMAVYRDAVKAHPEFLEFRKYFAKMLRQQGKADESIAVYREAIEAHPRDVVLREEFIELLQGLGKTEELNAEVDAIISVMLEQLPSKEDVQTRCRLGTAYLRRSQRQEALVQFQRVIEIDPKQPDAFNEIAWDLATDRNPKLRDGAIAVEFATKACDLTEWMNAMFLDTLAAACAESGDFAAAVKWQTQAIELESNEQNKEDFGTRLKLYQEKKPFRVASP